MTSRKPASAIVIGGGPAGASAAITLAQGGSRVILLEKLGGRSHQVAESLAPDARMILRSLGLWERFARIPQRPSHGNRSAWGGDEFVVKDFIFNPDGHAWHLDRESFDCMLLSAAEDAGVDRLAVDQIAPIVGSSARSILISQGNRQTKLEGSWLIDCTGRSALIARRQGARRIRLDSLVAVVAIYVGARGRDLDTMTTVEAVPNGWWHTALLPDGKRTFSFFTDSDLLDPTVFRQTTQWTNSLLQARQMATIVEGYGYELSGRPKVVRADTSYLDRVSGAGWVAAGEAALALDPLSSQGLLTAISTGRRAALAALADTDGAMKAYQSEIDLMRLAYMAKRTQVYAAEYRWSGRQFWKRRHSPTADRVD